MVHRHDPDPAPVQGPDPNPNPNPGALQLQPEEGHAIFETHFRYIQDRSWPKFILIFIVAKRQFGDVFQAFFKGIKKPLKAIL